MASGLLPHADSLVREAPDEERYAAQGTTSTSAVEGMSEADFAAEFTRSPLDAIHTLVVFADFGLVSKVDATTWLFPLYVKARGSLRNRIYEVLLHFNEPDAILTAALAEYRKYGNEERLAVAASLVADIGADALPALRVLARSRSPECEMFVSVMVNLRGIPTRDRLEMLAEFASNPTSDVRFCLLEALRTLPTEYILPLLTVLSTDEDEEIAGEARSWLESLEN